MAKVYVLSCRDLGLDCDFQARGATLEEVMQRSADHGAEHHSMKGLGPELYQTLHRGVKTVEEPESRGIAQADGGMTPPAQALNVTTELAGTIQVVHAAGRLDSTTAGTFDVRIEQAVTAEGAQVVLDLAHVSYVSSAGLRSLLVLLKRVKALGGGLVLAAVPPRVQDILDISGFTGLFAIAPTPADALDRLSPGR